MNGAAKRRVGIHFDSRYERHDTGPWHPESPERYRTLVSALEDLPTSFLKIPGRTATTEEVLLAHAPWYLDIVRQDVDRFADQLRTGDTPLCPDSYEVALEACGGVLNAVDFVLRGAIDAAFCAVRPPGHHATADRGMGFCIFNNIAIAARYLQKKHGITRVAIVDWDVHHGNGTEAIFLEDPDVLYISLHEQGLYPFTGPADERGQGAGRGTTLNLPLPAGSDGQTALQAWDDQVDPAVDAFRPEFLLVSAGFDAREHDPVGGLRWTDATFGALTRRTVALAQKWCRGRIVSALEGGYNPSGLATAAVAHVRALR